MHDPPFKYIVLKLHSVQATAFPPSVHLLLAQFEWQVSQILSEFLTLI